MSYKSDGGYSYSMSKVEPIVVIGGGPAGLACALELDRLIGEDIAQPIYLFDLDAEHTYAPHVYDVLTHGAKGAFTLPIDDIVAGTRVRFLPERVVSVDCDINRIVTEKRQLKFSDLVIATGCDVVGKTDESWHVHTARDINQFRQEIGNNKAKKHYVTVVGGGLRGVETSLALHGWLEQQTSKTNTIETLVHSGARLTPEFSAQASRELASILKTYGISVQLKKRRGWGDHQKSQRGKNPEVSHSAVWTTGLEARTIPKGTRFKSGESRRLLVDPSLRAVGFGHVWVAGSCAEIAESATVESAWGQGHFIARQIVSKRREKGIHVYAPRSTSVLIKLKPRHYIRVSDSGVKAGFWLGGLAWWRDMGYMSRLMPIWHLLTTGRLWV